MQEKKFNLTKSILDAITRHLKLKTYGELAIALGVAQSTISTWITRDKANIDLIFAKIEGLNYLWLKTGEGEMLERLSQAKELVNEHPDRYKAEKRPALPGLSWDEELLLKRYRSLSPEEKAEVLEKTKG